MENIRNKVNKQKNYVNGQKRKAEGEVVVRSQGGGDVVNAGCVV